MDKKKVFRILNRILRYFYISYFVVIVIFTSFKLYSRNEVNYSYINDTIYYKFETVEMSSLYNTRDLVLFEKNKEISEGDIILYIRNVDVDGEDIYYLTTSKVEDINEVFVNNKMSYVYTTANDLGETLNVYNYRVYGVYQKKISNIGFLYTLLNSQNFYLIFVVVPSFLLLGYQVLRIYIISKNEHKEVIDNEKE